MLTNSQLALELTPSEDLRALFLFLSSHLAQCSLSFLGAFHRLPVVMGSSWASVSSALPTLGPRANGFGPDAHRFMSKPVLARSEACFCGPGLGRGGVIGRRKEEEPELSSGTTAATENQFCPIRLTQKRRTVGSFFLSVVSTLIIKS